MANINNSITQDDVSALLNTTIAQMRGGAIANLSTGECISIAQTALRNAPDSLLNAISQTLSKTIFQSARIRRGFSFLTATLSGGAITSARSISAIAN